MLNKKTTFRIIKNLTLSAKENMAIDDSILQNFSPLNKEGIFRLYSWEDSFTIGASQQFSQYPFYKEYNGNFAKRITGGGVLFHGHDVSYSLTIPVDSLGDLTIKESYMNICSFIINFYKTLGLNAQFAKDSKDITLSKSEFCQVGFEAYDIVVDGVKIGGNAQKRSKKAIFQHGSIPIRSVKKGNIIDNKFGSSLEDFGINLSFEEVKENLIKSFNETFNVQTYITTLNDDEEKKKILLLKDKYDYADC